MRDEMRCRRGGKYIEEEEFCGEGTTAAESGWILVATSFLYYICGANQLFFTAFVLLQICGGRSESEKLAKNSKYTSMPRRDVAPPF